MEFKVQGVKNKMTKKIPTKIELAVIKIIRMYYRLLFCYSINHHCVIDP